MFVGRTDAKAETLVLWPPHAKSWLIGKDSDAGRDRGQEEKGMTEDEMAGWHHRLDGCESEWTLGVGDGQGGLACCSPWGCKESDTTEQLNWTEALSTTYTAKLFEVNIKLHKILFFVCVFANVIYLQKQKGTFNLTTISLSHLIILLSVLNASILWCRQVPVSIPNCPLIFCTHMHTHTHENTERLNQNLKKIIHWNREMWVLSFL